MVYFNNNTYFNNNNNAIKYENIRYIFYCPI